MVKEASKLSMDADPDEQDTELEDRDITPEPRYNDYDKLMGQLSKGLGG